MRRAKRKQQEAAEAKLRRRAVLRAMELAGVVAVRAGVGGGLRWLRGYGPQQRAATESSVKASVKASVQRGLGSVLQEKKGRAALLGGRRRVASLAAMAGQRHGQKEGAREISTVPNASPANQAGGLAMRRPFCGLAAG